MSERDVSRRSALKYLGLLAATAAGRDFLAPWLSVPLTHAAGADDLVAIHGATHSHADRDDEKTSTPYVPQFFKREQFRTVEVLTEMIIPTDDQPGAKEALVANYIDFVVYSAKEFEPSLQQEWREGLSYLDRESQKR